MPRNDYNTYRKYCKCHNVPLVGCCLCFYDRCPGGAPADCALWSTGKNNSRACEFLNVNLEAIDRDALPGCSGCCHIDPYERGGWYIWCTLLKIDRRVETGCANKNIPREEVDLSVYEIDPNADAKHAAHVAAWNKNAAAFEGLVDKK